MTASRRALAALPVTAALQLMATLLCFLTRVPPVRASGSAPEHPRWSAQILAVEPPSADQSPTAHPPAERAPSSQARQTEAATLPGETVRYRIDQARSHAGFEMAATFHTVHGRTGEVTGEFTRPEKAGTDGFAVGGSIVIGVMGLTTGNATRDKRMKSESLDAPKHPEIVFLPSRAAGRGLSFTPGTTVKFALDGELTIRGVTRPVSLAVTATVGDGVIVADGTTRLSFLDYGVPDPSNFFLHVKPELLIAVHIEALVMLPRP